MQDLLSALSTVNFLCSDVSSRAPILIALMLSAVREALSCATGILWHTTYMEQLVSHPHQTDTGLLTLKPSSPSTSSHHTSHTWVHHPHHTSPAPTHSDAHIVHAHAHPSSVATAIPHHRIPHLLKHTHHRISSEPTNAVPVHHTSTRSITIPIHGILLRMLPRLHIVVIVAVPTTTILTRIPPTTITASLTSVTALIPPTTTSIRTRL